MPAVPNRNRVRNEIKKTPSTRLSVFSLNLIEIIIAACGAAMLFLLAGGINHTVSKLIFSLAASAGIGIISGLYTRVLFAKSIPVMRAMVSLLATLLGVIAFNLASRWIYGVESTTRILPDWLILGQAVIAATAGWMAILAWQRKRISHLKQAARQRKLNRERVKRLRLAKQHKNKTAPRKKSKSLRTSKVRSRTRTATRPARPSRKPAAKESTLKLGRKRPSKKMNFGRSLEHRCPYCLEPVVQGDARGVNICSVCGAWHHQDCWDITGHCQVPHRGSGT